MDYLKEAQKAASEGYCLARSRRLSSRSMASRMEWAIVASLESL